MTDIHRLPDDVLMTHERRRDELAVSLHDRLDELTERTSTLKLTVSVDTSIRHDEDFRAIEQSISEIRLIVNRLDV